MKNSPFVSIIIPCRNEEKFIGKCLDSIIAQEYPKDRLEVLVIDGMSEDGTKRIVNEYSQKHPFIKQLENPKRITPCALNIGIKNTKGEIIIRMDAHATYQNDYIFKCVKYLQEYNVHNVGGNVITVPRVDSLIGRSIIKVLTNKFGVGNSAFRIGSKEPKLVDTVPFFCCRKEIFEKIGLFNEDLNHSQDMEFNLRLKKAGMKILLVPDIVSYYYARSDFKSFLRHNFRNGLWAILPFKYTNIMPVSLRHLVPFVFVLSLIFTLFLWGITNLLSLTGLSGFANYIGSLGLWGFTLIFCAYILTNLYFSSKIAIKEGDIRYFLIMPFIFTSLHISYGIGSIWGAIRLITSPHFYRNLLNVICKKGK